MDKKETRLQWARIVVTALGLLGLAGAILIAAARHDRELGTRQLVRLKQRTAEQKARQQERLVARLLERYLALETTEWERRDQALALVAQQATDERLRDWAAKQREEIAPYLRRIKLVQRYNAASDRIAVTPVPEPPAPEPSAEAPEAKPPGGKPPAFPDEGTAVAQARKSPYWKTYIKTREQLRLKGGRYCCRITTGRELFSKASSVGECRGYAQLLCDQLIKVADEDAKGKQKCFYALATACVGGEIIGAGDVTAAR